MNLLNRYEKWRHLRRIKRYFERQERERRQHQRFLKKAERAGKTLTDNSFGIELELHKEGEMAANYDEATKTIRDYDIWRLKVVSLIIGLIATVVTVIGGLVTLL